jgi:hypothetical protein
MTTATLFSNVPYGQNLAGPPVPANATVNAGAVLQHADFTLTVTPSSGFAEASVAWGGDGVNYPGQMSVYVAPGSGGSQVHGLRFHSGPLSPASGGKDGAQYFTANLLKLSPGATASLTMTY